MIDIKRLKNDVQALGKAVRSKNCKFDTGKFTKLDEERSDLIYRLEDLQKKKNLLSKEIGILKSSNKHAGNLVYEAEILGKSISGLEEKLKEVDSRFYAFVNALPNLCQSDVPIAPDEEGNVVVKVFGDIKKIDNPRTHDDILLELDMLDIENAVKVSGSRFVMFKKEGAILERALADLMLREHRKKGYIEYSVPLLVKKDSMFRSGQLPKFKDDAYDTCDSELYLIPTSEVSLVNIYSDMVFNESDLPKKMTSYTCCFRKESGSYGKDTKGLIRLHQFTKVELVQIVHPTKSEEALQEIVKDAEHILQLLEIPYRVVLKCTGDTGFTAAKTYDLEVWLPSQGKYREISSCSNTTDFQARRASVKFKPADNTKNEFTHMLNGSGLAVGRTIAALIENNQDSLKNISDVSKLIEKINKI